MDYEFTVDWFSMHIPTWKNILEPLFPKNRDYPIAGIEIGAFEGRSTVWLAENIFSWEKQQNKTDFITDYLVVIDPFFGNVEHEIDWDWGEVDMKAVEKRYRKNTSKFPQIETIKEPSSVALRSGHFVDGDYNFVYVDGNHLAKSALEDCILCHNLLTSGGILIIDDYTWKSPIDSSNPKLSPKDGVDAFMFFFGDEFELLVKDRQVILQKL